LSQKVICDPVHSHIYIDTDKERLILDLINTREVQRLRRISQLGVSSLTYPGAVHSRFSHALGTFHLAKLALKYLEENVNKTVDAQDRLAVLAAGLLHDIGHGPFSHVLEKNYGDDHESWTEKLITSEKSEVNYVLKKYGRSMPKRVSDILFHPPQSFALYHALLSSQLDVDRMDYLLRDSYFCGNSYGAFDYRWILHTMQIGFIQFGRAKLEQPMWIRKAIRAIEDYIFARYNMYWTVYYHVATRGYEELMRAILERAKYLVQGGKKIRFVSDKMSKFITAPKKLGYDDYLSLDDTVLFSQYILWGTAGDRILADLCNRMLNRDGLKWVDFREDKNQITYQKTRIEAHAKIKKVLRDAHYNPTYYFLESVSAANAYVYYHFEKEPAQQTSKSSIFILDEDNTPIEISSVGGMERLKVITEQTETRRYYYVPAECREKVRSILAAM
jgi:HD superfamily phosphohydrolase